MTPEQLAQLFHETYERLAPEHGYETRKESATAWEDVPANNKSLMIAVCAEILRNHLIAGKVTFLPAGATTVAVAHGNVSF